MSQGPKAIFRTEKVHDYAQIDQREAHNLRTKDTPNADPARAEWNQEYVNLSNQPIRDLVTARIREAQGDLQPRVTQVLCQEIVLTASPEFFARDEHGKVGDIRDSEWVKDNVRFAKETWGVNLVALQLHQDEVTPHLQGFVVPINSKSRLSADTVFNPKSLTHLQDEYAAAMAKFGLERGERQSRATHLTMQQMYARPHKMGTNLAQLLTPVNPPVLTIKAPTAADGIARSAKYQQEQLKSLHKQLQPHWQQLTDQLAAVGQLALTLQKEVDHARDLRWQLEAEKKLNKQLRNDMGDKDNQLISQNYQLSDLADEVRVGKVALAKQQQATIDQYDKLAQQAVQGTLPPEVVKRGRELHAQALLQAQQDMQKIEQKHFVSEIELQARLNEYGMRTEVRPGRPERVLRNGSLAAFRWAELAPGCDTAAAVVQRELAARAAAEQRGAVAMGQVVAAKGFDSRETFEQQVSKRGYDLVSPAQPGQAWCLRERAGNWLIPLPTVAGKPLGEAAGEVIAEAKQQQRQQYQREVTRVAEQVLKLFFTTEEHFQKTATGYQVTVTFPTATTMRLQHRSGEIFTEQDIKPNGRDLMDQFRQAGAAHLAQFEKEYSQRSQGQERTV